MQDSDRIFAQKILQDAATLLRNSAELTIQASEIMGTPIVNATCPAVIENENYPFVVSPSFGDTLTSDQLTVAFDKNAADTVGFQVCDSVSGAIIADSGALTTSSSITVVVPIGGAGLVIKPVYLLAGTTGAATSLPLIDVTEYTGTSVSFVKTQITDNPDNSNVHQHFYAKRQAFNANESLIYLYKQTDGSAANSIVVDLAGAVQYSLPDLFRAHTWHAANEFLMYGCIGNQFGVTDIRTNVFTSLYTGTSNLLIGKWEGAPDDAQMFFPLTSDTEIMVYSVASDSIIGAVPKPANYNWHGVSKLGNYVVAVDGSSSTSPLYIYDINMNLLHTNFSSAHDDFTVIAGVEYLSKVGTTPRMIRLSDNTDSFPGSTGTASAYQGHISGRGPDDLHLVSVIGTAAHAGWPDNSILTYVPSVGLDNPVVWGLHGSSNTPYRNQPKATISKSGNRVLYATDVSGVTQTCMLTKTFS